LRRDKRLIQQVQRNVKRFPQDFMFQLDGTETEALRSQIATSNDGRGGRRYAPYVFTEQGVAMLSGVLRSDRAIAVNIEIMRVFVELRRVASSKRRSRRGSKRSSGSWGATTSNEPNLHGTEAADLTPRQAEATGRFRLPDDEE